MTTCGVSVTATCKVHKSVYAPTLTSWSNPPRRSRRWTATPRESVVARRRARIGLAGVSLDQLLVKTCVQSRDGRVAHDALRPTECVERDLPEDASALWMVLIQMSTGDALHEKAYREGVPHSDPDVLIESSVDEIEQALLIGESETVELKRELTDTTAATLAKTAIAFANTKGGRIIFGIDDDHHIVGCDVRGMADRITNVLRITAILSRASSRGSSLTQAAIWLLLTSRNQCRSSTSSKIKDRSYEPTAATVARRAAHLLGSTDCVSATLTHKRDAALSRS